MSEPTEYIVKGISAPADFWELVDARKERMGLTSRSNFIRLAVSEYLSKDNQGRGSEKQPQNGSSPQDDESPAA